MPTGKEMCETIAEALNKKNPDLANPTAEEIWNASPTGELDHIYPLYFWAKFYLEHGYEPTLQDFLDYLEENK